MRSAGIKNLSCIIKELLPLTQGIYLFGSFGTEFETDRSDIDIAILLPYNLKLVEPHPAILNLKNKISTELGRETDIIDLRSASTVFQYEIISTGILIYSSDISVVEEFEILTISLYCKLNRERKDILDEIKMNGRIFV